MIRCGWCRRSGCSTCNRADGRSSASAPAIRNTSSTAITASSRRRPRSRWRSGTSSKWGCATAKSSNTAASISISRTRRSPSARCRSRCRKSTSPASSRPSCSARRASGHVPFITAGWRGITLLRDMHKHVDAQYAAAGAPPDARPLAVQQYVYVTDDKAEALDIADRARSIARTVTMTRAGDPVLSGHFIQAPPLADEPPLETFRDNLVIGDAASRGREAGERNPRARHDASFLLHADRLGRRQARHALAFTLRRGRGPAHGEGFRHAARRGQRGTGGDPAAAPNGFGIGDVCPGTKERTR